MSTEATVEKVKEVAEQVQEVAKVSNETVSVVMQKLEAMATGLGTTAKYLWTIIIKQAYITGIIDILCVVGAGILLFGYIAFIKHATKNKWYDGNEVEATVVATVLLTIITLVFTIISTTICIPEAITCFLNPEYWAFTKVLKEIR